MSDDFSLPSMEEELQALERAGVRVAQHPDLDRADAPIVIEADEQAALDAAASWALRRKGECMAEYDRYSDALQREIQMLTARYAEITGPLLTRSQQFDRLLLSIAAQADFGKKKSRRVGCGEYGRRWVPERIEIVDEDALEAALIESRPDLVRATVKLPLARARELQLGVSQTDVPKAAIDEYVKSTGNLPAGCERKAAHDEPWFKVVRPLSAEGADA
jgi:hypothetical protein